MFKTILSALAVINPHGRLQVLRAGANVFMPDFTPQSYRNRYDIYPGKTTTESSGRLMRRLEGDFHSIDRKVDFSAGYRSSR